MKTGKGKWTGRWSPYRVSYDIRGTGGAGYNQVQLSQCHWHFGSGEDAWAITRPPVIVEGEVIEEEKVVFIAADEMDRLCAVWQKISGDFPPAEDIISYDEN